MSTELATRATAFPWSSALYASLVGPISLLIVGFAALILVTDTSDVFLTLNGHIVGGLLDTRVLVSVATMCGGYGLYCVLRFRNDLVAWRSHH